MKIAVLQYYGLGAIIRKVAKPKPNLWNFVSGDGSKFPAA
jgi:hypothetical protein